jgi:hypothetical protein
MQVSKVDKQQEAIKRMEALGIYADTVRQFEKDGLISYSEPPFGENYWLNDSQKEIIRDFEEEYNAIVYFAVRAYTEFGVLDAFLYVSDHKDEWILDRNDINDGCVYAYVYNYDATDCSEIGLIGVQPRFGGLVRTW